MKHLRQKLPKTSRPREANLTLYTNPPFAEGGLNPSQTIPRYTLKLSYSDKNERFVHDTTDQKEIKKIRRALWKILREIGYCEPHMNIGHRHSNVKLTWQSQTRKSGMYTMERKRINDAMQITCIRETTQGKIFSVLDVQVSGLMMQLYDDIRSLFLDHGYVAIEDNRGEKGKALCRVRKSFELH